MRRQGDHRRHRGSDEVAHRERIEARGAYLANFYPVTWPDVVRRKANTEPWTDERLVIDSAAPAEANLARALAYLA